jgi:hypothetical protein
MIWQKNSCSKISLKWHQICRQRFLPDATRCLLQVTTPLLCCCLAASSVLVYIPCHDHTEYFKFLIFTTTIWEMEQSHNWNLFCNFWTPNLRYLWKVNVPAYYLTLSYKTHVKICHNYQEKLQIWNIQVIQVPSKYHNLTQSYWCFIYTWCCVLIL